MDFIYFYGYMLGEFCRENTNTSGYPSVNMTQFGKFEFQIPSISRQREISSKLFSFEDLTQNINTGLPAEIEFRRKQYEYYRETLLTFKELS
jgi:type I restriction enzyme S subunit